jgi:hypothetical protein
MVDKSDIAHDVLEARITAQLGKQRVLNFNDGQPVHLDKTAP